MSLNVLLVDDSSTMRKIIGRSLQKADLPIERLLEASDGYEGLYQVSHNRVDLILCDVTMPNMDGIEFLERVREMEMDKPIPVIMVTSDGSQEVMEEALSKGADGYLTKPFTPEEVRSVLHPLVER